MVLGHVTLNNAGLKKVRKTVSIMRAVDSGKLEPLSESALDDVGPLGGSVAC